MLAASLTLWPLLLLTRGACADSTSQAFTDVVVPFSQRLHEISLGAERVPGCTNVNSASSVGSPVGGQGNTPVTTTPSAVAGRKLLVRELRLSAASFAGLLARCHQCCCLGITLPCRCGTAACMLQPVHALPARWRARGLHPMLGIHSLPKLWTLHSTTGPVFTAPRAL